MPDVIMPTDLLEKTIPTPRKLSQNRKKVHRRNRRKIEIIYIFLGGESITPKTLRLECRVQEKRLRDLAWKEVNKQIPYIAKAKNNQRRRRHLYNDILMRKFEDLLVAP